MSPERSIRRISQGQRQGPQDVRDPVSGESVIGLYGQQKYARDDSPYVADRACEILSADTNDGGFVNFAASKCCRYSGGLLSSQPSKDKKSQPRVLRLPFDPNGDT